MFLCKKHGYNDTEWCDVCNKIIECDHMDSKKEKKSVSVYTDDWTEKWVEIEVKFCATCGKGLSGKMIKRGGRDE